MRDILPAWCSARSSAEPSTTASAESAPTFLEADVLCCSTNSSADPSKTASAETATSLFELDVLCCFALMSQLYIVPAAGPPKPVVVVVVVVFPRFRHRPKKLLQFTTFSLVCPSSSACPYMVGLVGYRKANRIFSVHGMPVQGWGYAMGGGTSVRLGLTRIEKKRNQ